MAVTPLNYSPKGNTRTFSSPADSLQLGAHSSPGASSKHKRMVSAVLHLKKESIGTRVKHTAFTTAANKAFKVRNHG